MNKFNAGIFFASMLIASAVHAEELQYSKVPLAQLSTDNTNDTLEFFVGVGAFNICFNLDPLNQRKCQPQCEALWNILTPDEILDILSWCTIGWYNQTYQTLYAPHIVERQKFIDLAQKVESAGVYIEDLNIILQIIDPKEPEEPAGARLLQLMFQQKFDTMKYHLIYTSLCSQCTADEALILHSLCTPTQFKTRMSIVLVDGTVEPVLFPTHYSPETIYDDTNAISESLTQFVESLTSQQKLFLLLESNLRSSLNLETIHTTHQAALDELKTKPGAIVMMRMQEFYTQVPENIHTGTPKENLVLVIPFEALYEKAQKIVETSGTPLQKALFKLQMKPQDFVNFNKELK
jgi:hypothetical protein